MVIKILSHVGQAYTANDGLVIQRLLAEAFTREETVTLSFEGVDAVPSSFVNGAFVGLLDRYGYGFIKKHVRIVNSTKQINGMIKSRLDDEMSRRMLLPA